MGFINPFESFLPLRRILAPIFIASAAEYLNASDRCQIAVSFEAQAD